MTTTHMHMTFARRDMPPEAPEPPETPEPPARPEPPATPEAPARAAIALHQDLERGAVDSGDVTGVVDEHAVREHL